MSKNPIVHFEIGCADRVKTSEFFKELFDWEITEHGSALTIEAGEGIDGHISELAAEWGNYVTIYVQVDDLDAYLSKAEELGGRTLVPPVNLLDQGSFAWFALPEGNIMALCKPQIVTESEISR
jgi:predicted enzyme related to lactoylglutathione lyase